ncbi:plasmodesmata-located protein 7 isoform X1 [Arachis hypogaea]|uniref:plasmodesmata-located protein 7 isoform X1 n=1 Tax=Arachis hypogaea TaxID=3818 RepID=UPI000DEC0579|nr:plasmodesmata-located protein 7 isoform X1 [Arachis hypogaea]QHO59129.1 Cysteine-rich repeat secretory protein [Arachis hypogaea]
MAPSLSLLSLIVFSLSLQLLPSSSYSVPVDTFVYGGCTQQRYNPTSPYESNLNSLLGSLVNSATFSAYNNLTVLSSSQSAVAYGLYQCRGDLAMQDCASCVARAVSRAGELCPGACGGAVQLDGCFVKYDNVAFVGVEDKSVVLRKCGSHSAGYDPEAVLVGLAGSGGYFRVGGSGRLKGVAQCTGDLSAAECQDCVGEAVRRLRSDCAASDYGDMFLGKCYARFSTGGAHGGYYNSKAHGRSDNEGEKTFAIIIGLLAGVALLIIFLAFLRRICEGQEFKQEFDFTRISSPLYSYQYP